MGDEVSRTELRDPRGNSLTATLFMWSIQDGIESLASDPLPRGPALKYPGRNWECIVWGRLGRCIFCLEVSRTELRDYCPSVNQSTYSYTKYPGRNWEPTLLLANLYFYLSQVSAKELRLVPSFLVFVLFGGCVFLWSWGFVVLFNNLY